MGLIININGIEEAAEFRKWLHKINGHGIDLVCDIIDQSINSEECSNSYTLNHSVLYREKDEEIKT